jgi:hypothetical protein
VNKGEIIKKRIIQKIHKMIFEVLMAMASKTSAFWDITPCNLEDGYQLPLFSALKFLLPRWRQHVSLNPGTV